MCVCVSHVFYPLPPQKCHKQLSRDFIRGKRMYCTLQLDYLELPPTRRLVPLWNYQVRCCLCCCQEGLR